MLRIAMKGTRHIAPAIMLLATSAIACARGAVAQRLDDPVAATRQVCPAGEPVVTGMYGAALDQYLTRLSAFGFSGTVLVAERDSIMLHRGYGLAEVRTGRAVTTSTAYNIASLTKPFTAAAILRLVTLGKLSTADSIGMLFGDVPDDKRGITVHQLLTHTSGLPRDVIEPSDDLQRSQAMRRILDARLRSVPGERYAYSNAGYNLLAAIIEQVSAQTYTDWLRAELFRPEGLQATGFAPDAVADDACSATPRNEWRELPNWTEWTPGWRHGSGDIVSSASDLYRWFRALRSDRLLSPEAQADLFTAHTAAGEGTSYGYGWFLETNRAGNRLVYHGGDNMGYHSEFRWYPDLDRVIVVLTHIDIYDDSGVGLGLHKRVIANAIERILDGDSVRAPPASLPLPPGDLERYEGTYDLPAGGRYTVGLDGGALKISADGQDAIDALLGIEPATASRLAAANERSSRLLDAIAAQDRDRLEELLSADDRWIIRYWLEDWETHAATRGSLVSVEMLGSKPLPWQDGLVRTVARLQFDRSEFDFQFTWKGDALYETLTEVGTPHAVILPIARLDSGAFASWDLVSARGTSIRFTGPDGSRPTGLVILTGDDHQIRALRRQPVEAQEAPDPRAHHQLVYRAGRNAFVLFW